MKKSLFALAAVGALASTAQAQSSVTVYGIVDAGYVGLNARVAPGKAADVAKNQQSGFGDSAESTSRLGFKGNEDLGGGLSAFFTVELGLNLDTAQVINTGNTQNRQSFVGLKKAGLGNFAFGTQYTVAYNAQSATDAGQNNNVVGDITYTADKTPTGGYTASNLYNAKLSNSGSYDLTQGSYAGDSLTVRQNNLLTVNTDNFSGFTGHAMFMLNNQNTNQTAGTYGSSATVSGGTNNYNGWGLGADYAYQKAFATVAYQSFLAQNPYAPAASAATTAALPTGAIGTPTQFGIGQGTLPGMNIRDNQWYAAATYDFGILKAYAQYVNRKWTSQIDPTQYLKRQGEQIGVRSFITPTIEAWAQGGLGSYAAYGAANPSAHLTTYQVGSNYWLSKRTNLYAIYGAAGTSNVTTAAGVTTSFNVNNYALGVRHTF